MEEIISFSKQYEYDTLKIGITIPVKLVLGDEVVVFEAKIDTGAANCIFERIHGERLGLIIESGENKRFRQRREISRLMLTKLVYRFWRLRCS